MGGTVARSRSESTGGIWSRVAHVFWESIQITDDIWDFFRLFGSAPYCYQFLPDLCESFKSFADASEIVDFIGWVPTRWTHWNFRNLVPTRDKANTGVRWVHITTRNETPRKSSLTPIHTIRDESSQTHLTVSTTLRSFRDKPFYKSGSRIHFSFLVVIFICPKRSGGKNFVRYRRKSAISSRCGFRKQVWQV